MNIAIVGSGRIGLGLGSAWIAKGHEVIFGVRTPESQANQALAAQLGARVESVSAASQAAAVVVLAIPYPALDEVLDAVGSLAGKTVIDCTNAVGPGMTLIHGHTTSAAEELQKRIPDAKVFKSFNAQGAENLRAPVYGAVPASNFFCGDDDQARQVVRQLVEDVGFDAVDAGKLANARQLEPLMLLWIAAAQALGTRDVAFKLLRR